MIFGIHAVYDSGEDYGPSFDHGFIAANLISGQDVCVIVQVTDENLIVVEVREVNVLILENTNTLPHLWGRTVGKASKIEPSKLSLTIGVESESIGGI